MKNNYIRKVPQPTKARFSNAKSDNKSEEESRQPRCHWLFEKSENRKGKIVPESTIMKKSHLRTKMNSQAQEFECDDDDIPLSKKMNACVSKQKISMKDWVKDLDSNDDEAESDSESVAGYHVKCFDLFGKYKSTKKKNVPKSGPIQESYPIVIRELMRSSSPES
ncbi:5339_t:CDS:1 [Acaulospora morrowiae]|uniref:5339_t:CDS:1 n=1 Tax=Acaulospora morrowiae TaxID=94023 RepID=A0A9N9I7Q8_9GLOM|nr:5339_t:CDS:1 [Acaulospora morrowiae]